MRKKIYVLLTMMVVVFVLSCKKEEEEENPTPTPIPAPGEVRFNLDEVPYAQLSDYGFFTGAMKQQTPNSRVLPYDVITPLFSDYAHKKRFVWMPAGQKAVYAGDHEVMNYPEGTVFIKTFYYDNVLPANETRMIETRLIYKKDGQWKFADYTWNEDQTEAVLDMDGGEAEVTFIDENGQERFVEFKIPSQEQCFTCHKVFNEARPIGPKPQNLNKNFPYADGSLNQLQKWVEVGYLDSNYPENITTTIDWTDESQSMELRVRSYVDMNCAHCHREGSHCDYRPLRLAFSETVNPANLGVCVEPEEVVQPVLTHIIARGNTQRSVMLYRMNTTAEQYRMPLLGRTVIHDEAVELFQAYIESLEPNCP